MDRIIVNKNEIKSKCNEFKPFDLRNFDINEQTRLQNWLNKNLKPIKFNKFLENLSETADEQDIKNTLEQVLEHKFPEEIMEVEVTKNLIIIGILSPYSKESALGGIEDCLGLVGYDKWYDEGDYAFDHMAYGFYKIKKVDFE